MEKMRERIRPHPHESSDGSSPERGLRWHHKMFLILVLAFVLVSAAALASSNEAKATHADGWYSDYCYWTYDDYYGTWTKWDCYYYYGDTWFYQTSSGFMWVWTGTVWESYDAWVLSHYNREDPNAAYVYNLVQGALTEMTSIMWR